MLKKLLIIVLALLITAGFYVGSVLAARQQVMPTQVILAKQDIPPYTKITKEMVNSIKLPKRGIPPGVAHKLQEVEGKYPVYGIPVNGYFFMNKVKTASELPEGALVKVKGTQDVVGLRVDQYKALGGAIRSGQKVDLWVVIRKAKDGRPFVGRLFAGVPVLSTRDSRGNDMEETYKAIEKDPTQATKLPKVPSTLLLAVEKEKTNYYFTALVVGEVWPVGESISPDFSEGEGTQDPDVIYEPEKTQQYLDRMYGADRAVQDQVNDLKKGGNQQ